MFRRFHYRRSRSRIKAKMLATRLLHFGRARSERDGRSAEAVLESAAERFGMAREPAIAHGLAASGVKWAQQMAELSDADWERLGVSLGLKTAVKAELADPSAVKPTLAAPAIAAVAQPLARDEDAHNQRLRRFLLLPSDEGKEAQPLGEVSAFFLGILATPAADRQNLMLALYELFALVAGLVLPIAFEYRRHAAATAPWMTLAADKGWVVPPTLADGMDAVVFFVFAVDIMLAFQSVVMALFIASGGWHADDRLCKGAMGMLATLFLLFIFCVISPLLVLTFWQAFTDAACPYPLLGCLLLMQLGVYNTLQCITSGFQPASRRSAAVAADLHPAKHEG